MTRGTYFSFRSKLKTLPEICLQLFFFKLKKKFTRRRWLRRERMAVSFGIYSRQVFKVHFRRFVHSSESIRNQSTDTEFLYKFTVFQLRTISNWFVFRHFLTVINAYCNKIIFSSKRKNCLKKYIFLFSEFIFGLYTDIYLLHNFYNLPL